MNFIKPQKIDGGICAPLGFTANGVHCGIRKNKSKEDLALIYCGTECAAAAVYTKNKVQGAPIVVTKKNLADGKARAVMVNSGNANTCNADGVFIAEKTAHITAAALNISPNDVIVASTGVIGLPLPVEPIEKAVPGLVKGLSRENGGLAAMAILTTDTVKKEIAVKFEINGKECRIGAIAKGSGMICPNMATLLVFITADVNISSEYLHKALLGVTEDTLNMVSIDGDTSTNDMVSAMASGLAGNSEINAENEDFSIFKTALYEVMRELSRLIAGDGEGAKKLLECNVAGAENKETAKKIAKSVISSNLFKAAMSAADANWGRILCAIGYADVEFDISKVSAGLSSGKGDIKVCENGSGVEFDEGTAKTVLSAHEIYININLNSGNCEATAWGCDLTEEYVRINADYRT
ncbi:MAG: bifunctional glutamate N-acetyltransferase/amino-acid acetyltransferase ArgJ [Oscillospiraceae bacterium]|nr:bifunctional glutamate N-acetyltransferase/amino-acid acetyltransferase ArgJ [Oscillospiraceae bacterium]